MGIQRQIHRAGDSLHETRPPANPARLPIDFVAVRNQIPIETVLVDLLGWLPARKSGPQWHGPCVVHQSQRPRSTSLAVHVEKNLFCCHKAGCQARGNVLDLWVAVYPVDIYTAAVELCERLGIPVPYLKTATMNRSTRRKE